MLHIFLAQIFLTKQFLWLWYDKTEIEPVSTVSLKMLYSLSKFSIMPKYTRSELSGLFSTLSLMVNDKQGSCEYKFVTSFSLTFKEEIEPRSSD